MAKNVFFSLENTGFLPPPPSFDLFQPYSKNVIFTSKVSIWVQQVTLGAMVVRKVVIFTENVRNSSQKMRCSDSLACLEVWERKVTWFLIQLGKTRNVCTDKKNLCPNAATPSHLEFLARKIIFTFFSTFHETKCSFCSLAIYQMFVKILASKITMKIMMMIQKMFSDSVSAGDHRL